VFGSFSAGDSLRVYRLQRRGISLDLQRDLTQPQIPLWEAWLAFVSQQAMGQPTYVWYESQDGEAFIQVRYRPHQAAADVAYLAPSLAEDRRMTSAWSRLLDGACIEAAGQGIQRVFANLPESDAEVDVFNQTGFMPYAREDIYRLVQPQAGRRAGESLSPRLSRAQDWPALQKLCVAITPQRVRQAEGGIAVAIGRERNCRRYVLPGGDSDDLVASLSVCTGTLAHWLRVLIHPDARHVPGNETTDLAENLICWGLATVNARGTKPVYCNVRQYETGVQQGLEAVGFELYATRTLMVKHTLAWTKTPAQELVPALKSSAELVPPAYHINGEAELQASDGRLAAKHEA
jgi:hypothetical protein